MYRKKFLFYLCFFPSAFRTFTQKHVSSLVDSTSVLYSVRGSLLYEKWESVPLFLPWCDVFCAFYFYPAAPLFLPVVIFSFFHVTHVQYIHSYSSLLLIKSNVFSAIIKALLPEENNDIEISIKYFQRLRRSRK